MFCYRIGLEFIILIFMIGFRYVPTNMPKKELFRKLIDILKIFTVYITILSLVYIFFMLLTEYEINNSAHYCLSETFAQIPGNNLSWLCEVIESPVLDSLIRFCYCSVFPMLLIAPVIIYSMRLEFEAAWHFLIAVCILQSVLALPLFLLFRVEGIWHVLGLVNPFLRKFSSETDKMRIVINCFPSMHISIAVTSIILTLRDKDKISKYLWGALSFEVVLSTICFLIHWTIDVISGIVIGVLSVKLTDEIFIYTKQKISTKILYKRDSI